MALFTVFLLVALPTVVYSKSKTISIFFDGRNTTPANFVLTSLEDQVNFSETLSLTVALGGYIDMVLNKSITLDVTTPDGIVPLYDAHVFNMTKVLERKIMVNFTSNVAPKPQRIPVDIIVSLSVLSHSTSITVQLTDDRVEIGFYPERVQRLPCYPNETCPLSMHTMKPTFLSEFNVTLKLLNSKEEKVAEIVFPVRSGDLKFSKQVILREADNFTATLSVPRSRRKQIYWLGQELIIPVIRNEMKERLDELTIMFKELKSDYDKLKRKYEDMATSLIRSGLLEDPECNNVDCGDFGRCVNGHCDCTYPSVYTGELCRNFVGCSDDPCQPRGTCNPPKNAMDVYECQCNNNGVEGQDCTECVEDYCSENGNCSVDDNGDPQCICYEGFEGDQCEHCKDGPQMNCTKHDDKKPSATDSQMSSQAPSQASSQSPSQGPLSSDSSEGSLQPADTGDNTLLYGGLVVFIAALVLCVAIYLAYHNRDRIMDLLAWKKESVVEVAMRSRTKKNRGYQKLPTSIHDTVTHED